MLSSYSAKNAPVGKASAQTHQQRSNPASAVPAVNRTVPARMAQLAAFSGRSFRQSQKSRYSNRMAHTNQ